MIHKRLELRRKARQSDIQLWGKLDDLCKKVRHWLYLKKQRSKAERYAGRLESVLGKLPKNDLAIIREEGLALLAELKGSIDEAISHRQREIRLMEQLHDEARSPAYLASTRAYMLRGRDQRALRMRREILESLKKERAQHNHALIRRAQ